MNTKRSETEENELLGRCLAAIPKREKPTMHPSSDLLLDYTDGKLGAETRKYVKLHLLECRMCSKSVVLLEKWQGAEAGTRGVVVDITRFFRGGAPNPEAQGENRLAAMAAATAGVALPAWELHEEGELKVGVTEADDGAIVVLVERGGVPVVGAGVVLEAVGADGSASRLAEVTTGESGESKIGRMADFHPVRPSCRYRILVAAQNEDDG